MGEEAETLRKTLSDLTSQNDTMQSEFFGTVTEDYQAQVQLVVE